MCDIPKLPLSLRQRKLPLPTIVDRGSMPFMMSVAAEDRQQTVVREERIPKVVVPECQSPAVPPSARPYQFLGFMNHHHLSVR